MAAAQIRIFVVDDQTIFRESLVAALGMHKDLRVVGHAGAVVESKPLIAKSTPDLLLLDVNLPIQSGLDLLREMPETSPRTRTLLIAGEEDEEQVVQAMRLGARGMLLKHVPVELFVKCLRKVHAGEIWLDGRMTEAILAALSGRQTAGQSAEKNDLSRRELEVIQLVIQGYKNRDIAGKLFISEKTVKNHLSAIFNKLGVTDRLELTLYVFEKRFFPMAAE